MDSIAQVHVSSWQHAYRDILPAEFLASLSVESRWASWREQIATTSPRIFVAEIGCNVIGFCSFGFCRDADSLPGDFEIWSIYVAPSHWSRGAGLALWLAARQQLIVCGATRIRLWVFRENDRAIRFYASAGFHPESDQTKVLTIGGADVVEMRYTQSLI